jgi:hypothetical protein
VAGYWVRMQCRNLWGADAVLLRREYRIVDFSDYIDYVMDYWVSDCIAASATKPELYKKYEKWQLRKFGNVLPDLLLD